MGLGRSFNNNSLIASDPEDFESNSPENSEDSSLPSASINNDSKIVASSSSSSPKRRRTIEKRVVSVPIRDVEGSRLKGETSAPPSDSWAWRKYGQKPIKGSPYPRGYYRCSSSKGCPARKQVERSRVDPNMLLITYSSEHNHPWPTSRNNQNQNQHSGSKRAINITTTTTNMLVTRPKPNEKQEPTSTIIIQPAENEEQRFANLGEEDCSLVMNPADGFRWFSELECSSSTMLESTTPVFVFEDKLSFDAGMPLSSANFSMREEDELLFADLGELPECTAVFGGGVLERAEEERRRCSLTPWF